MTNKFTCHLLIKCVTDTQHFTNSRPYSHTVRVYFYYDSQVLTCQQKYAYLSLSLIMKKKEKQPDIRIRLHMLSGKGTLFGKVVFR